MLNMSILFLIGLVVIVPGLILRGSLRVPTKELAKELLGAGGLICLVAVVGFVGYSVGAFR